MHREQHRLSFLFLSKRENKEATAADAGTLETQRDSEAREILDRFH